MKVGEIWTRNHTGSRWQITRLTKHTPFRDSLEEGVEVVCVTNAKPEMMSPNEKLLVRIFGEIDKVGEEDVYTRTSFLKLFTKEYGPEV